MKYLFFLFILPIALYSQNNDSLRTIKGCVWYSESYCKGIPPEKEMDEGHPYSHVKFYVIKNNTGELIGEQVLHFTSDHKGLFAFTIPKGEYIIVINYPQYRLNINSLPLSNSIVWTQGPEYRFNTETESFIQLSFYKTCPSGPNSM